MKTIPIAANLDMQSIPQIDRRCDTENIYIIESIEDYANLPAEMYANYLAEKESQNAAAS